MLIDFVGAPCSGKTTVAATTFAKIKRMGMTSEYVSEHARFFIANRHSIYGEVELDDTDQEEIMKTQLTIERVMKQSISKCDGITISDSSPLNSLLYMNSDFRTLALKEHKAALSSLYGPKDVIVVCAPLAELEFSEDPNRIHSYEESKEISRILELELYPFLNTLKCKKHVLGGNMGIEARANSVLKLALEISLGG